MNAVALPRPIYASLFFLLLLACVPGLFVPLLDNDSAHHANIALHMYLKGDYVNLVDNNGDYLDKPHFLFWVCALSYRVFGVTAFAYKLPSFLFTILGVWSTYRLGKRLYDRKTGRLAALIAASSFGYLLANNDVRMDAILTGAGAFAAWQGLEWLLNKKAMNAVGVALGLAIGFSTKGWSGLIAPLFFLFFYLFYTRRWRALWDAQLLLIVCAFVLFIVPVLYCYYRQFDLHPEKLIRGKSGRSGIRFLLWQQNFERFNGDAFGASNKKDHFFFLHTFLWVFAPWSLLALIALANRLKKIRGHKEWTTSLTIVGVGVLISLSGFKLPHYLDVLFPFVGLLSAGFLMEGASRVRLLSVVQYISCAVCLTADGLIVFWIFPIQNIWLWLAVLAFVAVGVLLFLKTRPGLARTITASAVCISLLFFLLNTDFYPRLLTYQGGNGLAALTRNKVDPKNVYYWPGVESHTYSFYTQELQKSFTPSLLAQKDTVWILTERSLRPELKENGLPVLQTFSAREYHVSRLTMDFINPSTRSSTLDSLMLIRVK